MSQKYQELLVHLGVVKQSPTDKIDEDFYQFMLKAKDLLGETSTQMAQFYLAYGHFLLQKIENNLDIFNQGALPNNAQSEQDDLIQGVDDEFYSSSPPQIPQQEFNQNQALQGELNEEKPIKEDQKNQPQIVEEQKQRGMEEGAEVEEEGQETGDRQICLANFEMALRLFTQQLEKIKKGESKVEEEECKIGLRKTYRRLGDLFGLDEDYNKSIQCYQKAIDILKELDGFSTSRLAAEHYFLKGSCYTNQNQPGCQKNAIEQFLKAFNILLNHLHKELQYDVSKFELPTMENPKVERFQYMCLAGDSEDVKHLKQLLSNLLDKIEDTHSQIAIAEAYKKEKEKMKVEEQQNKFKPVEDTSKVVHLGSFGNRKKKVEEIPEIDSKKQENNKDHK